MISILYFFSETCPNCTSIESLIQQIRSTISRNVQFELINTGEVDQSVLSRYNINSIPSLLIFENGNELSRFTGSREISANVDSIISTVGTPLLSNDGGFTPSAQETQIPDSDNLIPSLPADNNLVQGGIIAGAILGLFFLIKR